MVIANLYSTNTSSYSSFLGSLFQKDRPTTTKLRFWTVEVLDCGSTGPWKYLTMEVLGRGSAEPWKY